MEKKISIKILIIAVIVALAGGFFIGQETTKYKMRKRIEKAFSVDTEEKTPMGEAREEQNTNEAGNDDRSQMQKEIDKMDSKQAEVGDTIKLATRDYVVKSVEEKTVLNSEYGEPKVAAEGTKFVVVELTVTNTTAEKYDFDDDNLNLRTNEGNFYKPYDETIDSIDDYLAWRELSPKIPETGYIVYQLPETAKSYELLFAKANSNDLYRVKLK
jgi:hypothetical protein